MGTKTIMYDRVVPPGGEFRPRTRVRVRLVAATSGEGTGYNSTDRRTIVGVADELLSSELFVIDLDSTASISAPAGNAYEITRIYPKHPAPPAATFTAPTEPAPTSTTQAVTLPATNIAASTTGFASSGAIYLAGQLVTYTGTTPTAFTGCTGGSGLIPSGTAVRQAHWIPSFLVNPPTGLPNLHVDNPLSAHAASAVAVAPAGGIVATTAQSALVELDSELAAETAARSAADSAITAAQTVRIANPQATGYTTVLADAGKAVEYNSASAGAATIPPNASVAYPTGTIIEFVQVGAGALTLTPGAGVTITGDTVTPGQGGSLLLRKTGTNDWWGAIVSVRSGTYAGATTAVGGGVSRVNEGPLSWLDPRVGGIEDGGVAIQNAAKDAALALLATNGGTLLFPPGKVRIDSQIALPHDGALLPRQKSIAFKGMGTGHDRDSRPNGGSQIDLRFAGAVAKIDCRGQGLFTMEDLTLRDDGTSSTPFVQVTNTTLQAARVTVLGNLTKNQITCDQDAFVLGGLNTGAADGTANSPFQGYGTKITDCFFDRIRRGVFGRTYCNGVQITDNTFWLLCGSNLVGGAGIEFIGHVTNACVGNVITGNLFEMTGYPYGIKLEWAHSNFLGWNNYYDPAAGIVLAYIRCEANAHFNHIIAGYSDDLYPTLSDATANKTNSLLTAHQGQESLFPQNVKFTGVTKTATSAGQGVITENPAGHQGYTQVFSDALDVIFKPAGLAAEGVVKYQRVSANDKRLILQGVTNSVVAANAGDMRVQSGPGGGVYIGDSGTPLGFYIIGGTAHVAVALRHLSSATLAFFGAAQSAKLVGTPADATDLASAIALVNNLKAKLVTYGLIG